MTGSRCDGRNCPSYNGTCSFKQETVYCGFSHKIESMQMCPRKQPRLDVWW